MGTLLYCPFSPLPYGWPARHIPSRSWWENTQGWPCRRTLSCLLACVLRAVPISLDAAFLGQEHGKCSSFFAQIHRTLLTFPLVDAYPPKEFDKYQQSFFHPRRLRVTSALINCRIKDSKFFLSILIKDDSHHLLSI